MEREKRNWNPRKYIRLLMIVLSSYSFIFASPLLINMEYFPKVAHVSDVFTIKFYMDVRLDSSPQIVLNDDALVLEMSNMFIEDGKTVIENQYKIKKTGLVKLENILLYMEEKIIKAPIVELEVQSNPLSKETQFRTRILKYKETEDMAKQNIYDYDAKLQFTLGEKYFILIEGLFEKTEEQKISIQYELPENAFIEKLTTYPIEFEMDETWEPVAMFLWIPLKKGMQILPKFNLTLDISKTQEYKLMLEKIVVEVLPSEKKGNVKDVVKEDFQNRLTKELLEEIPSSQYTKEKIEIAKQIRELREKEHNSFFYADLQKKRKELEKELGLEDAFKVFHYKLYIMSLIIAIIFFSYPIYCKIVKNKVFSFFSILSFCIGIFIFGYGIKVNDLRKEYTFTDIGNNSNIYISPDINSTVLEEVRLGETIKIVYTSNDWFFVETGKNIRGWMQK